LHSRCTVIDFAITDGDKNKSYSDFHKRLQYILNEEKIEFDPKILAELIQKYYPDFRRTINELQRYSVRGKIDSGVLFNLTEADTKKLIAILKDKRFNDMRKWVIQNLDKEPSSLFSTVYEILYKYLQPQSIPQAVLVIAGYQYKAAFVADQEINMVACLTEVMANCKFK
jgi:DNA polymerase III delta prime subunit